MGGVCGGASEVRKVPLRFFSRMLQKMNVHDVETMLWWKGALLQCELCGEGAWLRCWARPHSRKGGMLGGGGV